MARIGVMKALNRHVERVFNSDRKDTQWGKGSLLGIAEGLLPQIRPIRTDKDHRAALAEIEKLWGASSGTPEGDTRHGHCIKY